MDDIQKIFKYPLKIEHVVKIQMQRDAEILHVGLDPKGNPAIWALVTPGEFEVPMTFYVIGTGHEISLEFIRETTFIGTFLQTDFMWHVFKRK